ncbi:MAG: hypothetical protein HC853_01455 [Anaerolineae bacterium]|nr:hypothetical protein [Anaerolineae bacterium]
MKFLDANDPDSALDILMVLAEELQDGVELVDDSDGYLGDYALGLGLPMAEAILSLDLSKAERTKLIEMLKKLDAELDDYGMSGLDVAIEAATYGWEANPPGKPTAPQTTTSSTTWQEYDEDDELVDEGMLDDEHPFFSASDQPAMPANDLTEAKLNVLNRRGEHEAYLALCKRVGRHLCCVLKLCDLERVSEAVSYAKANLNSTHDALEVGKRLRDLKQVDDAIAIGELGLTLPGRKSLLGEWLGPIEETQNRSSQALQAWLAAFTDSPKLETYKTIKRLNQADWQSLQTELMQVMRKSYDHYTLVEVLLFEAQWDEAIAIADESAGNYRLAELVAEGVMKERPAWVIEASRKQAEVLIAKTQSKYYVHAAEWLRRMKQAYGLLGQSREWQKYLDGLKEQYRRRPALQAQLRGL